MMKTRKVKSRLDKFTWYDGDVEFIGGSKLGKATLLVGWATKKKSQSAKGTPKSRRSQKR
jgi:hypothetical protein